LTKDEIISGVWKETALLQGNDEALDQLIFRLRQKIEENPNHPRMSYLLKAADYFSKHNLHLVILFYYKYMRRFYLHFCFIDFNFSSPACCFCPG